MADETGGYPERTHYHFRISLRISHPNVAPQEITDALGIEPFRSWMAGERRSTLKGEVLEGVNGTSYWTARVLAGRWPKEIGSGIHEVLAKLVPHRQFFHNIRMSGGKIELFIGWFFENQSGGLLTYECLALAGDLKVDLSFDVYPPDQPQNEYGLDQS